MLAVAGVANEPPVASDDFFTVAKNSALILHPDDGVFANDSDPDGDWLSVRLVSEPDHGTLSFHQSWLVYIPEDDFVGADHFSYRAADREFESAIATVTIDVDGVNHAPIAADDAYLINSGQTLRVGQGGSAAQQIYWTGEVTTPDASIFAGSRSDLDGDRMQTLFESRSGAIAIDATHDALYVQIGSGIYRTGMDGNEPEFLVSIPSLVNDIALDVVGGKFYWTVEDGIWRADLDGANAEVVVDEGSRRHVGIDLDLVAGHIYWAIDRTREIRRSNLDGSNAETIIESDRSISGSIALNVADGTMFWSENRNIHRSNLDGTDDEIIFTNTATIHDFAVDPIARKLYVTSRSSSQWAAVMRMNFDGSQVQSVVPNLQSGVYRYAVGIALDQSFGPDYVFRPQANDSDLDGDVLTVALVAGPTHGSLLWNDDGSFDYTADEGFFGTDSFRYVASDGQTTSNVATVTINVNDPPILSEEQYSVAEDTPLVVDAAAGVLANAADPNGDVLTAQLVSGPSDGELVFNADGSFSYTPSENFFGTDSFTFRVFDGWFLSDVLTATITVDSVNDPPVAVREIFSTPMNTPLVGGVGEADERIFDTLAASGANTSSNSAVGPTFSFLAVRFAVDQPTRTARIGGQFEGFSNDNGNGKIFAAIVALSGPEDIPNSPDLSTSDVLGVALLQLPLGNGALIDAPLMLNLTPGWYALVYGSGQFGATGKATARGSFTRYESLFTTQSQWRIQHTGGGRFFLDAKSAPPEVLGNDRDVEGDPLVAQLESEPAHGTVLLASDGTFGYTPDAGFTGRDSFSYVASDGTDRSRESTVTISVFPPPVRTALDDAYAVVEDQTLNVAPPLGVLANDVGQGLRAELIIPPKFGTLALADDGSFSYTPNAKFSGADQFFYRTHDGEEASGPAIATITVSHVNDIPIASDDAYSLVSGETLRVGQGEVLGRHLYWVDSQSERIRRSNLDGTGVELVVGPRGSYEKIAVDPVHQRLYWTTGAADHDIYHSRLDGSRRELLIAQPDFSNGDAMNTSDIALDIAGGKIYWSTWRDSSRLNTGRIWRANLDGSGAEMLYEGESGAFFEIELDLVAGQIYWVNWLDWQGRNQRSTIQRSDLDGSNVQTLPIPEGWTQAIALDPVHRTLYWTTHDGGSTFMLQRSNLDGSQTQVIFDNFEGSVFLEVDPVHEVLYITAGKTIYRANLDGSNLEVLPFEGLTQPWGLAIDQTFGPGGLLSPLANDRDVDGDLLSMVLVDAPAHGTLMLGGGGSFEYTPDDGFVGTDVFTYRASDGVLESNVASVTLHVPSPRGDADLTGNGFVDFEDLTVLLAAWNQNVSAAEGNLVDAALTPVNFEDLTVLLAAWTGPAPAGAPVGRRLAAAQEAVGGDSVGDSDNAGLPVAVGDASYKRRDEPPWQIASGGSATGVASYRERRDARRSRSASGIYGHLQAVAVDRVMAEEAMASRRAIVGRRAHRQPK